MLQELWLVNQSGIIGALWKNRHIYTVIHYKDELDEQKIVLDFEDNIDKCQPYIYNKMVEAKKGEEFQKSDLNNDSEGNN
ncbi:MAG TPA: hypothetical protein VH481_02420 [Nitrososphaeraceae archaeon]|jgi:hypothetical protein